MRWSKLFGSNVSVDRKHIFMNMHVEPLYTACVRANNVLCLCRERYRIAFSYQLRYRYRLELFSMLRAIAPEVRYYSSFPPCDPPSTSSSFQIPASKFRGSRDTELKNSEISIKISSCIHIYIYVYRERVENEWKSKGRKKWFDRSGNRYSIITIRGGFAWVAGTPLLVIRSVWHLNIEEATSNNMPAYLLPGINTFEYCFPVSRLSRWPMTEMWSLWESQ